MTSRDFCYWLQGYLELASCDGTPVLSNLKRECIQNHLNMVFKHEIDPSFGSKKHLDELTRTHSGSLQTEINC